MDTLLNKAEITMDDLRENFQEHDFSAMVSDYDPNNRSSKEKALYIKVRRIINNIWDAQMKIITNKRMRNFSIDSPVGCIKARESALIAGEVMKAHENKALYRKVIHAFFEAFHDGMVVYLEKYTLVNNKTPEELSLEDFFVAVSPLYDKILDFVVNLLLRVQEMEDVVKQIGEIGAHEDFNSNVNNYDRSNFERKWDHTRSKIGKLLSIEEIAGAENEVIDSINMVAETIDQGLPYVETREEAFIERLKVFLQHIEDPTDRTIVKMRFCGMKFQTIANKVELSCSTVSKRIGKMRVLYEKLFKNG